MTMKTVFDGITKKSKDRLLVFLCLVYQQQSENPIFSRFHLTTPAISLGQDMKLPSGISMIRDPDDVPLRFCPVTKKEAKKKDRIAVPHFIMFPSESMSYETFRSKVTTGCSWEPCQFEASAEAIIELIEDPEDLEGITDARIILLYKYILPRWFKQIINPMDKYLTVGLHTLIVDTKATFDDLMSVSWASRHVYTILKRVKESNTSMAMRISAMCRTVENRREEPFCFQNRRAEQKSVSVRKCGLEALQKRKGGSVKP